VHLRSLRVKRSFIPITEASLRKKAVLRLKKELHPGVKVTATATGIVIEGELLSVDIDKIDVVSSEVSDWVRSSRRYK